MNASIKWPAPYRRLRPLSSRIRTWVQNVSCDALNQISRIHYKDPTRKIGILDYIRWSLEKPFSWLFGAAFRGSDEELQSVIDGEVPVYAMSGRQIAFLNSNNTKFDLECIECGHLQYPNWRVGRDCEICAGNVYPLRKS